MADREQLLTLATDIVSAHVSNNAVPPDQLPSLIQQVFNTLATVEQKTATPPRPEPAVPIKQSVTPGHIVCLECGKQFSMIKRHLTTDHKLTPEQYRQRWELPRRTRSWPRTTRRCARHWPRRSGWDGRATAGRKKGGRGRA